MSENQDAIIKQSLIVNAYANYHNFVNFLKCIPIDQNNMLAQEAYKLIDIGMICFEKVISQCPIIKKEEAIPQAVESEIIASIPDPEINTTEL